MAFWHRAGPTKLRPLVHLLLRRRSRLPAASASAAAAAAAPYQGAADIQGAPRFGYYIQFRSFAAPVQAKPKNKSSEDESTGPRINNEINAPVVRLVTDTGHSIVSLREALQHAAELDLDLVEVARTANPPVCKIMDFHKEKYKKEVKEKERAKSKSTLTLRSGENKEVRFKAKTELKDLKVKAEAITRLMERGYRVKCTALPAGNSQEEDLGELLSRLLALIEEVSVLESGPHIDSKQAYAIVRHIKFATKKSGKKASKAIDPPVTEQTGGIQQSAGTGPSSAEDQLDEEWEIEPDTDSGALFDQNEKVNFPDLEMSQKFDPRPEERERERVKQEQPVLAGANRYARPNPNPRDFNVGRGQFVNRQRQFQPSNLNPSSPSPTFGNFRSERPNMGIHGNPDPSLPAPRYGNFMRERPSMGNHSNPNPSSPYPSYGNFRSERPGNTNHGNPNPSLQPPSYGNPNPSSPPPNYGNFRSERPSMRNHSNPNPNPSSPPPPKNFGSFSADKPNSKMGDLNSINTTTAQPRPKLGIFHSSKPNGSGEESNSNTTDSQVPKFGIFSTKKTVSTNNQS